MKNERRPILLTIIVYMVCSIMLAFIFSRGATEEYNQGIGMIGLGIMVWCAISSQIMYGKFLTLILMFELAFYLFTAGQSLLYALKIPLNTTLDLYWSNSAKMVNSAYIFTFFCIMLFHLGTMVRTKGNRSIVLGEIYIIKARNIRKFEDYSRTMIFGGWIVLAISFIPYAIQSYSLLSAYSSLGYKEAYQSIGGATSWGKLFSMLGDYFVFGVFMLLAAYKDNRKMRYIPTIIILLSIVWNFSVGNRSEPICYAIALLWFYKNYANSKMERKMTTLLMITGIAVIVLIVPIIGQTRNAGTLNISTITEYIVGKESVINLMKDTIITLGWSGFPMIKTMEIIPSQFGYHYGESYFFALLALIPNVFGGTHISVKYAGLPQWLKNTLYLPYGPGYSMPAEAYYNFGWAGMLIMFLFGIIVHNLLDESIDKDDSLKLFAKMGLFIVLFSIPRREMLTALRDGVYLVGFLYLGIKILHSKMRS